VVCTACKEQEVDKNMRLVTGVWKLNVNFLSLPPEMIDQWGGKIDKTEWVVWADWYNKCPNVWNLAYVEKDDKVTMFMYGIWEPLEREMRVLRITSNKKFFTFSGDVLREAIDVLRIVAKDYMVKKVYFETEKYKVFERKLKGDIKLDKARILEVL